MRLIRTFTYEATKTTAGELLQRVDDLRWLWFYDPRDKVISAPCIGHADWLATCHPKKTLYIVEELSYKVRLEASK